MAEAVIGALVGALTAAGVGTTAATIIATITVASPPEDDGWPDDGAWRVGVVPGQAENPREAAWRALATDPQHVAAVQAAMQTTPEGVEVRGLAGNDAWRR